MTLRRQQLLWYFFVGVVPTAIVAWMGGTFVWNHFIAGPYLHDSGWYSAIVWRQGFIPANPETAHPIRSFYGIHVSLLVSVASLLSYLSPVGRVGWYCLFQAAIYAPLGAAVAVLDGDRPGTRGWREAARAALVGLVFALNGQVLSCLGYPHFEIFIPAALCIMLGALATNRRRLAWAAMLFACGTREDGGLHAVLILSAVLASDFTSRPFPVPRAHVLRMAVVAFIVAGACFVLQKKLFVTANLFHEEYLGTPVYGHVDATTLAKRSATFFERVGVVWMPLLVTLGVAVYRRDPRVLLGWVAELPWLLLNFFAAQADKAAFSIYTGFPFVVSIFWVAAYARAGGDATDRGRWLGPLLVVALASIVGFAFSYPYVMPVLLEGALWPRAVPSGLASFADAVGKNPRSYGKLYWESQAGSWAIERLLPEDLYWDSKQIRSFEGRDGVVFYLKGDWFQARDLASLLARSPFSDCRRAEGADVYMCLRPGAPPHRGFVPSSPLLALSALSAGAKRVGEGIVVEAGEPHVAVYGPGLAMPSGSYEGRWRIRWGTCNEGSKPRADFDVFADNEILGHVGAEGDEETIVIPFTLAKDAPKVEMRSVTGRCAFTIESVTFALTP